MGYGDALMICALAKNIRKAHPGRRVAVSYVSSRYAKKSDAKTNDELTIYRDNPYVDRVFVGNRARFWTARLFGELRNHRVIDARAMTNSYNRKVGEDRLRHIGVGAVENMCALAGVPCVDPFPDIVLSAGEKAAIDNILDANGLRPGYFIVVETETKKEFSNKRWFPDYWRALIAMCREKLPDIALVRVGPSDTPYDGLLDLSGRADFRGAARFLERSLTYIGPEGGLGHLAAAVRKRAIVIHSGFDPSFLTAYPGEITLYHRMDCSDCGRLKDCPNDRKCVRAITPDEVFAAIQTLIAEARHAN